MEGPVASEEFAEDGGVDTGRCGEGVVGVVAGDHADAGAEDDVVLDFRGGEFDFIAGPAVGCQSVVASLPKLYSGLAHSRGDRESRTRQNVYAAGCMRAR